MDWTTVKEYAHLWYSRLAQFFLFQNVVLYLFACVTARAAIGLTRYIVFLNHCAHWFMK